MTDLKEFQHFMQRPFGRERNVFWVINCLTFCLIYYCLCSILFLYHSLYSLQIYSIIMTPSSCHVYTMRELMFSSGHAFFYLVINPVNLRIEEKVPGARDQNCWKLTWVPGQRECCNPLNTTHWPLYKNSWVALPQAPRSSVTLYSTTTHVQNMYYSNTGYIHVLYIY